VCESLEERLALSHAPAPWAHHQVPVVPSFRSRDINGDGTVNVTDLQVMARSYLTVTGDANFNPDADLNRDGKVNQYDARYLEKGLPAPPPRTPLRLKLHLAPGQQVPHPGAVYNSGAVARRIPDATILGHTIPGALVIADSSQGLYNFDGPLLPTDEHGNFVYHISLDDKINTTISFLVIDQYGRQLVRNYPVFQV
jgi:hypothetical protein